MSEINVYPPPPPPPPPSRPASSTTFDFVEPFAFVFQDERWLQKVLIGGLFYIATIFLIGIFFILGYCARLTRNVIAGVARPLPEWDDLGIYLTDGVKLFCVMLLYALPLMAIALAFLIPAGIFSAVAQGRNEFAQWASGVTLSCVWCLIFPISLALSFWMPAALMFAIIDDRIGAAFEFRRIFNYIRNNFVNYLLAFLVFLVARFAVPFGAIALCIGVFFTAFWAVVVATYGFAQAYRLSPTK
jgi:uncharacterized protein DUF4013